MPLLLPNQAWVLGTYAALLGETPGNSALVDHAAFIDAKGLPAYKSAIDAYFASWSNTDLATAVLKNLGISSSVVAVADAAAVLQANAANRAGVILDFAYNLYTGTDAKFAAVKAAFVDSINTSYNYSIDKAHVTGVTIASLATGTNFTLTTGQDNLNGTSLDDFFKAYIVNNGNTLNSGDVITGGAGFDTLFADIGSSQSFAITPETTGVEAFKIRAESNFSDATNGNNISSGAFNGLVQIDAQRMSGVNWFESNNSRTDVVIEDVRIAADQKTSDVTIAFVESDPGNVDYGVYFDQFSLRNASSGSTTLKINIMDTGAAAVAATADTPLLNNPYDLFKLGINDKLTLIQLDKVAVAAADTYEALLAVFQTALTGTGVTATLGDAFTITDPITSKPVTGKSILLSSNGTTTISTPAGSGWYNTTGASVPATSNIYTTYSNAATSVTELVTSTIVLDDVGRGSTGGDLVVGGMSTGDTSTSRGVERFEIEVRDNSKLQTINSTNNALREVVIKNGVTSDSISDAYTSTVKDEGNLTVNGDAAQAAAGGWQSAGNNQLPGVENNSPVGIHHGAGTSGFVDVRLIDASAFKGKFEFTAAITSDSIAKYIDLSDTQSNPAGDVAGSGNVNFDVKGANFIYTGGNDNDKMVVAIDNAVAGSRSTVVSGQSDFTFSVNGGEGKDEITLRVIENNLKGGAQAWYTNQKLNANIAIDAGAGDDTIKTPGAGDVIINAGTGNDTVFTDNTGVSSAAFALGSATPAAKAYADAAAAELAAAQAVTVLDNTTGFVKLAGTEADGATFVSTATAAAALDALKTTVDTTAGLTYAQVVTAVAAAVAAGGLSFEQQNALNLAYQAWTAAGTITKGATLVANDSIAAGTAHGAGAVAAADLAAGNTLLATYLTAAHAADATDVSAVASVTEKMALLDVTQTAVVTATQAVNQVYNAVDVTLAGTQVVVNGLTALQSALAVNATDATVSDALKAAIDNGSLAGADATTIWAVVSGAPTALSAAELSTINLTLLPLINTANNANTAAQGNLTAAINANNAAVNSVSQAVASWPTGFDNAVVPVDVSGVAGDEAGSIQARAAASAAANALTIFNNVTLTPATNVVTGLSALKAAIVSGTTELQTSILTTNAKNAGTITALQKTAIDTAAGALAPTVLGAVDTTEKTAVDNLINAYAVTAQRALDIATLDSANLKATADATEMAAKIAEAAAASGTMSRFDTGLATFVFNTSNQAASYNNATMDDRNLADLKSDANNTYKFFNSTLSVVYKGIEAKVVVPGTGYTTSDLEVNQAIKAAVKNDAVLSKLIEVTDGPANSLVVKSLIDGVQATKDLSVSVKLPTEVTAADLAGAIAAGVAAKGATTADLLTAMAAQKVAFDAKGDYTTQFAETGAGAGDANMVGANSTSSSDNTINLGDGNDVLVLGTTVLTDGLTSSNEKVIFTGTSFGNDTIVHFDAAGLGIDVLDFTALKGSGAVAFNSLSADKSIVVAAPVATALSATEIAALFTDSATAINHVYVAVDAHNIGSVWQVADAAGTATGNVTATLVGTIDLADTAWGTLTAANFA